MQKYLDRTCTAEERDELVQLISFTSDPTQVDNLWKEVWSETDSSIQYEELSWEALQELNAIDQRKRMKVVWRQALRWSAVAAVLIGIFFIADWEWTGNNAQVYETGFGETLKIVLDDGTRVDLNADSRLIWDKDWKERGARNVRLEGEAYFDVSHVESLNKIKIPGNDSLSRVPFIVVTPDLNIRVLGTAFNAFQRRGKTEVFLERGVVELSLHRQKRIHADQSEREMKEHGESQIEPDSGQESEQARENVIQMSPGDFVSFSLKEDALVLKSMETTNDLSEWKEGILRYQDEKFSDMLQNLEDLYGKSFEVEDQELLNKRVHFSVPYEDWNTVKEMMELMLGIKINERVENKILIKKRIVNQSVK